MIGWAGTTDYPILCLLRLQRGGFMPKLASPVQNDTPDKHIWPMRWFALIILAIGFLGAIAACIITRSPFPLAITIIMRPTLRWLFPGTP